MPNGRAVTVDVVRHSRSVVIVPSPTPGKVILVRQYRYAVNAFLWELPAGSVDEGESPGGRRRAASATRRSAWCRRRSSVSARCTPTPGYCDEEIVFFRLSGLEKTDEKADVDEDEDIESKVFDLADARDMVRSGEIRDMKTLVGLTLI